MSSSQMLASTAPTVSSSPIVRLPLSLSLPPHDCLPRKKYYHTLCSTHPLVAKPPVEPRLDILTINLTGAMYTIKLALHHFRRQNAQQPPSSPKRFDLILQGSLAGYLDLPGAPEYSATKFAMRGIMRDLRRTEWQHNIRVNYIGPWYVRDPRVHLVEARLAPFPLHPPDKGTL